MTFFEWFLKLFCLFFEIISFFKWSIEKMRCHITLISFDSALFKFDNYIAFNQTEQILTSVFRDFETQLDNFLLHLFLFCFDVSEHVILRYHGREARSFLIFCTFHNSMLFHESIWTFCFAPQSVGTNKIKVQVVSKKDINLWLLTILSFHISSNYRFKTGKKYLVNRLCQLYIKSDKCSFSKMAM